MKKIVCLLLFLLLGVSAAPAFAAVETIKDTVLASSCTSGADIVLQGDTTLVMDADLTLGSIRGDYALTIRDSGGHTLTITMPMSDQVITANGAGHGISVKSLTCDANLDIKARKDALNVDGDIEYTAKTLGITCGGDGVYSRSGNITLTGVSSAMLEAKGSCFYAPKGIVRFEGASLMAESTGSDSFCVAGNNVILAVTNKATVTAKANAIVSGGGAGIWLSGEFDVTGGHSYGYAVQAKDTGSIVLAAGTELTAASEGGGLWAGTSVQLLGNGKLDVTAKNKTGISAETGDLTLKGTVKVNAKKQALLAKNGAVAVNGSVNAQSSENSAACIMGGSVSISGESLYAAAKASAILSTGEDGIALNLSGPITAVSDSASSSVLDAKFGGSVSVSGGAGSKLIGAGYGVYSTGKVTLKGNGLKIEAVKDAVHADGDGVWIYGDVELSTESEKYTGVYTSAEDADIQLVNNGSLTVTSAGRGICTKGAFHKNSTGTLTVEAADTAIEAKNINLFNYYITITSKNEYGLVAAENVNIECWDMEIHALKSCITAGTIRVEGSRTCVKAYTDEDMEYYRNKKILDPYYRVIVATGDITLAAGKGFSAHACGATPIYAEGKITFQGPVDCHQKTPSKRYLVLSEQGFFVEDHLYLEKPTELYIWSNDAFYSDTWPAMSFAEKPQISGTVSIKTSLGSSTVAVPQDMIESSLIDVSDGEKSYQWQSSTDNVNWTDLDGQTSHEFYVRAKHTGLWLRVAVSAHNHVGQLYSNAIMVPESTMLEGGIVYTSGAKVGGKLTTARTGLLKTMEDTAPDSVHFQWQHSLNGENYWEDIEGATNAQYVVMAGDIGTFVRLVASVDGMTGKVVSPAKEIAKAPAGDTVSMSSLSYAEGVVTVTKAFENQEYVMTLSANEPSANEWQNAVSPETTGELTFPVSGSYLNNTVYVHTRVKETGTTLAGTKVKNSRIYTGQGEYLKGLVLENTSGNPVSNENSKAGRIVPLKVSPQPDSFPSSEWNATTVNWYVNNNPSYPGAVELYKDADCTTPLERDEYNVIKPTTQHTVYYKAASWTNNVMIGASVTIGYNEIVDSHMYLNVSNENDEYILQSMHFENIEAFPGDEITTGFVTRPAKSYLGELTFRARNTNPASQLTVTADTANQKVTIAVPEDAVPGIYSYDYLIDGVKPANGTYIVITVKEKTATVTFASGTPSGGSSRMTPGRASSSSGATMAPQTVPLGSEFILPENGFDVPEGYEFNGWNLGEAGDGIDVTQDVTVTAKWKVHVHTMVHESGYETSCAGPGMMEHWYCESCGKYYGDENGLYSGYDDPAMYMIPAADHTWGEPVTENEVEAACTQEGGYDTVIYCTVCGAETELSRTHTKTADAKGHTPGAAVSENPIAATCTEAGSHDEVVYCSVCGEELSRAQKTDAALGHALSRVSAKAAACTESGNIEHWVCTNCGLLFADAAGTQEIADSHEVEIEALEHSWGEWKVSGEGEKRTCSRCGQVETKKPVISLAGGLSADGKSINYTIHSSAPASGARLLAASYDAAGRMLGVQTVSVSVKAGDTSGTVSGLVSGAQYKLFLLDGTDFDPLCEAVGIKAK